ncbi:MAG: hypothetical protein E6H47_04390, partial [Betaproteobacteria bacterium]
MERWILLVSAELAYQVLGPYVSELDRLHALERLNGNQNGNVLVLDIEPGKRPVIRCVTTRGVSDKHSARNASTAKRATAAPGLPQQPRAAISPETRIDELELKPKAISIFLDHGLTTLRDLAALPEAALRAHHGIGRGTLEKLRSIVRSAGLRFAPPPDPVARLHWENRQRRAEVSKPAAPIADDAALSALGLLPAALTAATRRGLRTVSDLVSYTPLELSGLMSRRAVRDTMERLTLFGRSLQPESPKRLNGFGLIERSEYLNTLSVRTPVKELRQLLGRRAISALQAAGFEGAGDLLSRSLPETLSERDRA